MQRVIEESPQSHVLGYQQFRKFLEKSYGQTKTVEITREFTDYIDGLATMLDRVSPFLTGKLKSRCYRLKKKLQKCINGETESESSHQESEGEQAQKPKNQHNE